MKWIDLKDRLPRRESERKIVLMHVRDDFMYVYTTTERGYYSTDQWTHWLLLPLAREVE